jgi:hypothetical protein
MINKYIMENSKGNETMTVFLNPNNILIRIYIPVKATFGEINKYKRCMKYYNKICGINKCF